MDFLRKNLTEPDLINNTMDKEEIKSYLQNNLTIEVDLKNDGFDGDDLVVTLLLEGKKISDDKITIRNAYD